MTDYFLEIGFRLLKPFGRETVARNHNGGSVSGALLI